jgi:hypothetical protein
LERNSTAEAVAWGPQVIGEDNDLGALRVLNKRRRLARRLSDTSENGEHRAQAVAAAHGRQTKALAAKED